MQAMIAEAPGPAPTVTVLMTTWNGADFISASIASVLAQSFRDFELIVVDDGSTDGTAALLAGIADPRLVVLRQAVNGGIVAARNAGFAIARGRYVAMLDHDDLSLPERLAKQVAYLEAHPTVMLVATEIVLERNGKRWVPDHPRGGDPVLMRWLLHVDNPLTWSSVMVRADVVRKLGAFVRPEYELADDFDLYHRLLTVGDIARLDDVLTVYRWHVSNTTYGRAAALHAAAAKVLAAAYRPLLGPDAEDAAALVIQHLSDRQPAREGDALARLGRYLARLLAHFSRRHQLQADQSAKLMEVTGMIWWRTVRATVRSGRPTLLKAYRAESALTSAFQPPRADIWMSTVMGFVRGIRNSSRCLSRLCELVLVVP